MRFKNKVNQRDEEIEIQDLSQNTLKITSSIDFDIIPNLTDAEIHEYTDSRGFTILMLAAEAGQLNAVQNLINRGEELNYEIDGNSASDLAFANGHSQVLLALLNANAKIPKNYESSKASDELKIFLELSEKMHEKVREVDEKNLESLGIVKNFIKEKIEENSNLRYFYNLQNFSLLKTAILEKKFEIYELLLSLNIFLAPHESMDELLENLNRSERKTFSEINFKLSPELLTEPMMILLRNCKLGPDTPEDKHGECMFFIRRAFEFLFAIPFASIVLKIVAASRDFKIVFDFKRDFVTFLDPRAEPYTNGLFYLNGKIYIAAKDLLDSNSAIEAAAVIAHELCHYAMFLVYENDAKPYKEKNLNVEVEFSRISDFCESRKESDETINYVYELYDSEFHHAELIVRVCQMSVLYRHDDATLNERKEIYKDLFDFYEGKCMPEMEVELPKIEEKFNHFKRAERRAKNDKILIFCLLFLISLSFPLIVWGANYLYNPTIAWGSLKLEEKEKVKNATINFQGVKIKFGELFANDSNVYGQLSSEQLKELLKGGSEEFSRTLNSFDREIYLSWTNLTESLKKKFLTLEVDFQGQKVPVKEVIFDNSTLDVLTPTKIREIFFGIPLKIHHPPTKKVKFYFPRQFVGSNYNPINFSTDFDAIFKQKVFLLSGKAGEGKSTAFEYLTKFAKEKFPSKWVHYLDLKKYFSENLTGSKINFSNKTLVGIFLGLFLNLSEFDSMVFQQHFQQDNVIFLWDGVDEISPLYTDFMLDLSSFIKNSTKNFQFIATRPQYKAAVENALDVKSYRMVPLQGKEKYELLAKFIFLEKYDRFQVQIDKFIKVILNLSFEFKTNSSDIELVKSFLSENNLNANLDQKLTKTLEANLESVLKGHEIILSIEVVDTSRSDRYINNPLMVELVADVSTYDEIKSSSYININDIYEIFIAKKLAITGTKSQSGTLIFDDFNHVINNKKVNVMQVHQGYALSKVYSTIGFESEFGFQHLNIMKSREFISRDEISRFGILHVYSKSEFDFEFSHRTFAEFLTAQFFIDNMDSVDPKSNNGKSTIYGFLYTRHALETLTVVNEFMRNYARKVGKKSRFFSYWLKVDEIISQDQELRNDRNLWDVFEFAVFSHYFWKYHKVSFMVKTRDTILDESYGYEKFEGQNFNFVENWAKIEEKVGRDVMKSLYFARDRHNQNFLHHIARFYKGNDLKWILNKMKKDVNKNGIRSLILAQDYYKVSPLMLAVFYKNLKNLEIFWNFIEEHTNRIEQQNLLKMRSLSFWDNPKFGSTLESCNDDTKEFIEHLYEDLILKENIEDELKTNSFVYLRSVLVDANFTFFEVVLNTLEKTYENDLTKLQEILLDRDEDGISLFSLKILNETQEFNQKLKLMRELFNKTFIQFDQQKFILLSIAITLNSPRVKMFESNDKTTLAEDLFVINGVIKFRDWNLADFLSFFDNYEDLKDSLGNEGMKNVITSKNIKYGDFLGNFLNMGHADDFFEKFLEILAEVFSPSEISSLLDDKSGRTNEYQLLVVASKKLNSENFKKFYNFHEKYLNKEQLEEIVTLISKDNKKMELL